MICGLPHKPLAAARRHRTFRGVSRRHGGIFLLDQIPHYSRHFFDAVTPGLGHGCKQSLEAFSHSTRLEKIVFRLLERDMLSPGIRNPSTKCKLFGQSLTNQRKTPIRLHARYNREIPNSPQSSESLLHAGRHRPQAVVDLSWRLSENQAHNGLTCDPRVLEGTEDVDLGVGEHDPRPRGVLDGVSGLAVLACNTADGTGEMVALKGLDILEGEIHVSSLL